MTSCEEFLLYWVTEELEGSFGFGSFAFVTLEILVGCFGESNSLLIPFEFTGELNYLLFLVVETLKFITLLLKSFALIRSNSLCLEGDPLYAYSLLRSL